MAIESRPINRTAQLPRNPKGFALSKASTFSKGFFVQSMTSFVINLLDANAKKNPMSFLAFADWLLKAIFFLAAVAFLSDLQ